MFNQNFDEPIKFEEPTNDIDIKMIDQIKDKFNKYVLEMDSFNINKGLNKAIELSKELNGYIDITMPWTLKDNKERLGQVLLILLNGIYSVATMLKVVLPNKMVEATKQLGISDLTFNNIFDFKKFDTISPIKGESIFERLT